MSATTQFGFGKGDTALTSENKPFKGEAGKKYRISFVWWDGVDNATPDFSAGTPNFIGGKRMYIPGVGYVFDKGPEYQQFAGQGGSRTSVASVIVIWPTHSNGKVDEDAFKRGDFQVKSWVFGVDKYRNIKDCHDNFSLDSNDIVITCTDSQYQKMTFVSAPKNLFRTMTESKNKAMQKQAKTLMTTVASLAGDLNNTIAKDLTVAQIKERLGAEQGNPTGNSDSTADIDNMLGDLLD